LSEPESDRRVRLSTERPIWDRFFTVAPLVVIGTREEGGYDLAPKHMATPLGWENHFGFVCTPDHATYRNAREAGCFTVTYLRGDQSVAASLTAAPRCDADGAARSRDPKGDPVGKRDPDGRGEPRPDLETLPTFPASEVDGVFLRDGYLFLECELERIVDGFGRNSLVAGRVVAAEVAGDALRASERPGDAVVRHTRPLVYLSPGRFAVPGESHAFPFPAGFHT